MKPRDLQKGISLKLVLEKIEYREGSGKFYHREKVNQHSGEAGYLNPDTGYVLITINGERIMAHRLAWVISYARWPKNRIDHINGIKDDNRLCNLREATDGQNKANSVVRKDNRAKIKGVRFHESGKWQSRIWDGERNIHLGLFDSSYEAKIAYDKKALELFGEFARSK